MNGPRAPRPPRALIVTSVLPVLAVLAIPAIVRGEDAPAVLLSGENRGTALRLEEARQRLDEKKWPEAIEALQAILNTAGNDLVPVGPAHSVQARRLCQVQLATLPPDALILYRRRYETQARKKLDQARAERDELQLRRLVEEAFCTRAAEKAIDLLGDRAFERGRFDEAEEWWRLLSPLPAPGRDAATRGLSLVYPDPTIDPARTQAKQLLARLFRGSGPDWADQLDAFRARHATAEGTLAGRAGRYVDRLRAIAAERAREPTPADSDWPTFGGEPGRGRIVPAGEDVLDRLSALCGDGPTWRFNLADHGRQEGPPLPPASNAAEARSLAFHPVIVGHRVLVSDACRVAAFDLRTGQSEEWYDIAEKNEGVHPNLKLPAPPDLRYTLTAADGDVYVRLGAPNVGPGAAPRENETFVTCLGLRPDRKDEHLRWSLRAALPDNLLFEGAPLVADGQLWVASVRYNDTHSISSIDCYPADDTTQPPRRWRRDVCETRDVKPGEPRYRHHLLTLAGTQIVYCTHTGAVVALDALTGRTNWAIRYPRRAAERDDDPQPAGNSLQDLAPVLSAAGRLYVAPADSDRLLCLDPATGRILWEREAMKVVHLLGVGQGRLIFSTRDGLRAVGAANGSDASGWLAPQAGTLVPAGRGLLIGDLVLFPTIQKRDEISTETAVYVLRQRDGLPAADPALLHRVPAGNLVYANGCLVVADRHTLSLFVAPRLLLPLRQAEAKKHPASLPALLRLGRAEADAGRAEEAVETFRRAESKARGSPTSQRHLHRQAITERQHVLINTARRAAAAGRWEDAAAAINEATEGSLPARARLSALAGAAQIWEDVGQPARAIAAWEAIRADDSLRRLQGMDRHGKPISAASAAITALARLRGETPSGRPPPFASASGPPSAVPSLPLFRSWHLQLNADEWILDGWQEIDPDVMLTGSPDGRLTCRLAATGAIRWHQHVSFFPRWAGSHAGRVLIAGERDVACFHRDDGALVWHVPAPVADLHPAATLGSFRVVEEARPPEPLSAFRLVAGRLFFLQGQRHLFALDAQTGEFLWDRRAPDSGFRLPYPFGRFSPFYHAGPETVLVQSSGRRWLLDAATGRTIHQAPDGRELWSRPPLELDERTLAVVSDRRNAVLIDSRTGRPLWTHTLTGGTTLSGEPPALIGRGDLLWLVTPRNVGYSLERLDRATGKPLWSKPRLLAFHSLRPETWTFDHEAIYLQEEQSLLALSVADGAERWRRTRIGTGRRQLRRLGDWLAVSPVPSEADFQFRFRSPLGSVQWVLGPLLTPEPVFAVDCLDPRMGRPVQRLNFRLESPARTTWRRRTTSEGGGRSVVARTSLFLASADGPVVRLSSPRPFVAAGAEVWGLRPEGMADGRREPAGDAP